MLNRLLKKYLEVCFFFRRTNSLLHSIFFTNKFSILYIRNIILKTETNENTKRRFKKRRKRT